MKTKKSIIRKPKVWKSGKSNLAGDENTRSAKANPYREVDFH